MFPHTKFVAVPALCLACACAAAGPPGDSAGGVVTSQAVTVAGHDFCQYFIAAWRDKEGSEHYTLAIRERPSARWGSEVWIEYAHRRVFQTRLPPARAAIRSLSEEAAETTYQAVLAIDAQRKLINDVDLAPDEF
jgi:curli production assembly/transport component CsgE